MVSRANQVNVSEVERIEVRLAALAPRATVLRAAVELESVTFSGDRVERPDELAFRCVLPVCGIGNPDTFIRSVDQVAGRVCEPLLFDDHQRYRESHVRRIVATAERRGADLVVTTRKDWVKLAALWSQHVVKAGPELARLDVRVELQDDEGEFDRHLCRALEKRA